MLLAVVSHFFVLLVAWVLLLFQSYPPWICLVLIFLCSKETGSKAQVIREYNLIKTTLLLAESMQWCNYSDFKYSDDFNVTLIESLWFKFPWPAWVGRLIYWCRPAKEKHEIIVAKNTLVSYNCGIVIYGWKKLSYIYLLCELHTRPTQTFLNKTFNNFIPRCESALLYLKADFYLTWNSSGMLKQRFLIKIHMTRHYFLCN